MREGSSVVAHTVDVGPGVEIIVERLAPSAAAQVPAPRLSPDLTPAAPARTALYVEAGGNGVLYTLNAERLVGRRGVVRVGLALLPVQPNGTVTFNGAEGAVALVPITGGVLLGNGAHRAELAGGLTLGAGETDTSGGVGLLGLTGTLGYRYGQPGGGVVFRAGFTPTLTYDGNLLPLAGLSVGRVF